MKKKIKVLMCGSALSNGGGVVSVTCNYLNYKEWDNVHIEYIPTHINGNAIKKIIFFITAYFKVFRMLCLSKVDIMHLHLCDGGPFYRKSILLFTAHLFHVKTILHHHTDYGPFFSASNRIKKMFIKKVLQTADTNLVLGECLKEQLVRFSPGIVVKVIRNGIYVPNVNPYNKNGFGILFLGWFHESKGFFDFLDAFTLIKDKIDQKYKLILCGGGTQEEIDKIKEYGVEDRIYYIGWADANKKEELFKNVVINVLPSYKEGLPMSIIETMSFGIPNIATNITTIPEIIINEKSGYITDPGNIEELAKKMELLLNDSIMREKFSIASFEKIKNDFDVIKQLEISNRLYHELTI